MIRSTLLCSLLASVLLAPRLAADERDKPWTRSPKEIAFQNDSQWEDNRWQETDLGPFLTASVATPAGAALKGIAIRVGAEQEAAVCFDTAMLRISAAWTGPFLQFSSRRFGLIGRPAAAGTPFFSTPQEAGWAQGERFRPERREYNWPGQQAGVVHLPKNWAAYRGLYTSGDRVVLSYSVGQTDVLESPWFIRHNEHAAFIRSLEIGPCSHEMRMRVADGKCQVAALGDDRVSLRRNGPDPTVLVVPPREETIRVKLLISKGLSPQDLAALRNAAGEVENLSRMINSDSARWPETLTTEGTTTESGGPYVIDTLTLPFDNPYKALLFTAGHDFFSNGDAAVCTVHGDVWVVSGIDRRLRRLRWRRFATGLFQPLGLKIVDDKVYVLGRDQVTRLHDRDGNGEADFYENFNNDLWVSGGAHEYVTCLDTDPDRNFYFIHARTGVMRLAADGSTLTSMADGFRNPNGMAVGPDGTITAAPQQGTWTPESSIVVVKPGGYYGFGGPRVSKDRPLGWDLPMCFIPRAMDNSGGAQVWVEGDRWGPLTGQMLHLSYGRCRLLLALIERVDGVYQGGTIQLPTEPADFESGIMRGRFSPHDGQLYVTGLRGWQTRAIRDGCFQRLRYTGGPLHLPTQVRTFTNGLQLTFTEPLDAESATDVDNYFVEQWNYRWSEQYGSPDFSVKTPTQQGRDELAVVSATLLDGGRTVFLEMPGRQAVMQISVSWLLQSGAGERFRGTYAHTINSEPRESFPEGRIVRRARRRLVAADVEARLQPGLQFTFRTGEPPQSDTRTARLAALRQEVDKSPTPLLPAAPFSLEMTGTIRIPLSGFYDFRLAGDGAAELWINDEPTIGSQEGPLAGEPQTSAPVLLHKGHNLVRVAYQSPVEGTARCRLWWRGQDFDWEPVPPRVFFHDSGSDDLQAAQQRRRGRQLFAERHCARCHQTDVGRQGMFELSLPLPDLAAAGERFHADWLRQWLLQPASLRNNVQMPAVLGVPSSADARRDAADITAYLLRQRREDSPEPATDAPGDSATDSRVGERLFEGLGCLACHHFQAPGQSDRFQRVSLHYADVKFRSGALVRFLRQPAEHHAATAMPDFRLNRQEAQALAAHIRKHSQGRLADADFPPGDADRGAERFRQQGCQQCHSTGPQRPALSPQLTWPSRRGDELSGCLADSGPQASVPWLALRDDERRALHSLVQNDLPSLMQSSPAETSARLVERLRCAACHDRDGRRSHRFAVVVEEGSGKPPYPLPQLTWTGEKLWTDWTEQLLAGRLDYNCRPWLDARMPAFPAYAAALAEGLAAEHAVDPVERPTHSFDAQLAAVGQQLSRQSGLDCRQCHGIGALQPRGDERTQIHKGVNFLHLRDRLRGDFYRRFILNPPRYDIGSNMPRLSQDGLTTKLQNVYDGDARRQFDALWHYIQSLPDEPTGKGGTRLPQE